MTSAALFVHLLCFVAYVGAGFAQTQLMKRSQSAAGVVRDELEALVATIVTKIEVPAIFGSMASGVVFIAMSPALMKQGWMHGKLTVVLLLAVLSHLEMFNARAIVRERKDGASEAELDARKKKHATFGAVGALLVLALMVLVTFVRLG